MSIIPADRLSVLTADVRKGNKVLANVGQSCVTTEDMSSRSLGLSDGLFSSTVLHLSEGCSGVSTVSSTGAAIWSPRSRPALLSSRATFVWKGAVTTANAPVSPPGEVDPSSSARRSLG